MATNDWESWAWKKRTHGSVLQPASFQRRYVRIEKSVLSYFKRPSDVEPRGSIKLDSVIRIFPSDPSDVGKSKPAKDFGAFALSLSTSSRTYHFLFETSADYDTAILSVWSSVLQSQCTLHAKLRSKLNISMSSTRVIKGQQPVENGGTAVLNNPPMSVTVEVDARQPQISIKPAITSVSPDGNDLLQNEDDNEDASRDIDDAGASTAPSKSRWLRSMFVKKKGADEVQEVELQTRSLSDQPQGPPQGPSQPTERHQKSRRDARRPPKQVTKMDPNTISVQFPQKNVKQNIPSVQLTQKNVKQNIPKQHQRNQTHSTSRPSIRGNPSPRGPLTEKLLDDEDEDDDGDDSETDDDDDDEEEEEEEDSDDESEDEDENEKSTCCTIS